MTGSEPWTVVVAGVSGSGKSTVAAGIAARTGAQLADGDDFHAPAAVEKMRAGTPLTDVDRAPWLRSIGAWIDTQHRAGVPAVISCSALRRTYRDVLRGGRPYVRFLLLDVPAEVLDERLARRTGHFMPASLLPSQLALLQPLGPEEPGATIDATGNADDVVSAALRVLHVTRA